MYMLEIQKPNAIGITLRVIEWKMSEIKFDYDDYDYRISSKLLEIYFLILECKRGILKVFSWKWYYAT